MKTASQNEYVVTKKSDGIVIVEIPSIIGSPVSYYGQGFTLEEALANARELRDRNETTDE